MITEIILVIFAILYYMFSVFFIATVVQDVNNHSIWYIIECLILTVLLSPIATPIILGIKLGEWVENN